MPGLSGDSNPMRTTSGADLTDFLAGIDIEHLKSSLVCHVKATCNRIYFKKIVIRIVTTDFEGAYNMGVSSGSR